MKLKNLLKESQHLSYKRMNVGEDEDKGMTNEEKKAFLEAVSAYRQLGEMISHKGDLREIHESIKKIVENANSLTLKETGDWFDNVTVNRHMKSMNESYKIFSTSIKEVVTLQQRMESAYDEIGEVLGKYYEIKEGNEFGAARAKAIAAGEDEFEVDGKKYKVTSVDADDKKNAKKFANESTSMNLSDLLNEATTDKTTLDLIHKELGKPKSMPNPVNVYSKWQSIQRKYKLNDKAFADYLTTYFKKDYDMARKFYMSNESVVTSVDADDKENAKKFTNEAKVIVHNEKTGERYEVLSGKGKGDLLIAMNALQKAAPKHMKYSLKENAKKSANESVLNERAEPMLSDKEQEVMRKALSKATGVGVDAEVGDVRYHNGNSDFAFDGGGNTMLYVGRDSNGYYVSIEGDGRQIDMAEAGDFKSIMQVAMKMAKKHKKRLTTENHKSMKLTNLVKEEIFTIAGGVALGLIGTMALIKGAKYVGKVLGGAAEDLVDKLDAKSAAARVAKKRQEVFSNISPILKKFENDSKLQSMYNSLPPYRYGTSDEANRLRSLRNKKLKEISDYIKSKLTAEEQQYFADVSKQLRGQA